MNVDQKYDHWNTYSNLMKARLEYLHIGYPDIRFVTPGMEYVIYVGASPENPNDLRSVIRAFITPRKVGDLVGPDRSIIFLSRFGKSSRESTRSPLGTLEQNGPLIGYEYIHVRDGRIVLDLSDPMDRVIFLSESTIDPVLLDYDLIELRDTLRMIDQTDPSGWPNRKPIR